MRIKQKIQKGINQLYLVCFKAKNKRSKGIVFARGSKISSDDVFEGNNYIGKDAHITSSRVGYGTYFLNNCWFHNASIGRYCSIAADVKMVSAKGHPQSFVSSSPVFHLKEALVKTFVDEDCYEIYEKCGEDFKYDAVIGNDVWIGTRVMLMGAVTIGDGAIIGAGTIVNKDVPPYAVVAGVPARIIRYRFSDEQMKKLLDIKWWNKPEEWLKRHAGEFGNIEQFIREVENNRE